MALRRNKDTGAWERQQADGSWAAVAPAGEAPPIGKPAVAQVEESDELPGLDSALSAALNGVGVTELSPSETARVVAPKAAVAATPSAAGTQAETASTAAGSSAGGPTDVDFDIPGLTSGDSARSTTGSKSVRERLMARRGTGGKRVGDGAQIVVGEKAARVSGPATREGTEARARARAATGRRKAQVDAGETSTQRYVNRPAPALLESRPRWVQELFEAHFRSDLTLSMRKEFKRMKLSRQDYAIGWLTAFDKFRAEPAVLRLKEGAV